MSTHYLYPLPPYLTATRIVVTTHADGTPCSYVDDLTWDFNGMLSGSFGKPLLLNFEHIDIKFRLGIQNALYVISKEKNWGFATISNYRQCLQHISEAIGSTDWNIINNQENYFLFKKSIRSKNFSQSTTQEIHSVLNTMFDCGLTQRYISPQEGFYKKCSSGIPVQQHIALPEPMMTKLLSKAIEVVEFYHPYRNAISAAYNIFFTEYERRQAKGIRVNKMISWANKNIQHGIPSNDFFINAHASSANKIQTACWLVLIGFSGIRTREGLMMNPSCYDDSRRYNNNIIPLIHGKISKNQSTGKPKKESWITHPIVKLALELAYDMSEFARAHYRQKFTFSPSSTMSERLLQETSSAFLMLSFNKQKRKVVRCKIGDSLHKFSEDYDVRATSEDVLEFNTLNPTRKGQLSVGDLLPKLSNHDFRRSYAVFFIRNRFGNIMSLRSQFKHDNIIMTTWYQNGASLAAALDLKLDAELQQMIQTANQDVHEKTLFYIYNEAKTLSGVEGGRIMAARNENEAEYPGQIYMTMDEIRKRLRNNTISIVEHPTGFCFKPDCDRICSSDKSSELCKHEVITPEKAQESLHRHQRLVCKFRALNNDRYYMFSILSDIQTHIKGIEKTLIEHNIEFEPFTDKINSPKDGVTL